MSAIVMLVGLGIVALILALIFIKLGGGDNVSGSHYVLQILILGFIMVVFALVGKVAVDNSQDCNWNLIESTISGNTTTYINSFECTDNTGNESTSQIFYKWMIRFVYIISIYLVLYLMYAVLTYFGFAGSKGGKEDE